MLPALITLQVLILIALVVLLLRKPASASEAAVDPRLAQLLGADLSTQFTSLDVRSNALDKHLREEIAQLRKDTGDEAQRFRTAAEASATSLRKEVQDSIHTLGGTLRTGLDGLRSDNKKDSELLRATVEGRLDKLGEANVNKLEEMRKTVDEKLEKTLHTRLTQSFGQVSEQLTRVHEGLGEMTNLAAGVGDLKRVLSNVKSRGIIGEFFLGQQLEQMFAPDQYIHNARIKPDTLESVEYALRIPNGPDSIVLLAIDSKFPKEDWERLEESYDHGSDEDRKKTGAAFERAIRAQGKLISEKYIDTPHTLPFAIMYLPTEAIYAEVMRRPGLHAEIQSSYKIVIAGPSAFAMILTSFKMVFDAVKFQKNLNDIWNIFQIAQREFEKFGTLMEKVETQVGTVQRTLKEIGGKTKTVNRAFKNASKLELGSTDPAALPATGFDGLLPMLEAEEENEDDRPPQ